LRRLATAQFLEEARWHRVILAPVLQEQKKIIFAGGVSRILYGRVRGERGAWKRGPLAKNFLCAGVHGGVHFPRTTPQDAAQLVERRDGLLVEELVYTNPSDTV
jgi:hypothetical protein